MKSLRGFGGRSVLEIVASDATGAYRPVYTVKFRDVIYVLHAFQKKSKKGIATPQNEMDLIHQRFVMAEQHYRGRQN